MSLNESLPNPELQDASSLYTNAPPRYVGHFVMSKESARTLPVNITEALEPAISTLAEKPVEARQFAERFGKLSVNVALDETPTSFSLIPEGRYTPGDVAQIKTVKRYVPSKMFRAEEQDARYAFLLFDDKPMTVELGLIQALHMLDFAIVTDQFDGTLPVFRAIDYEQLVELQSRFPEVLARTYGNVRGISDAPEILGTVVPTDLLEKSQLDLQRLEAVVPTDNLRVVDLPAEREKITVVGITTAKLPHIGHGFLITKAIAEAGEQGQVVVELNDLGPRVACAVSALASQLDIPIEQAVDAIIQAEIAPSLLETAYRNRDQYGQADLPNDFALTANNAVYERLLSQFGPLQSKILSIANSSQEMRQLASRLLNNPSSVPLFGDKGMVLLGREKATVVVQEGKPTLAGVMGALATGYQVTMVDSPAPLDRKQAQIFEEASIPINQVEGIGLSLGFGVASGTGGEAPSLQEFLSLFRDVGTGLAPFALRALLNDSVFIRGEGKSLNPNYANAEVLREKLSSSVQEDLQAVDIYKPFKFRPIGREVAMSLTPYSGENSLIPKGKISPDEIAALISTFPSISRCLPEALINFRSEVTGIPKSLISQQVANLINKIRTGDPKTVFGLQLESLVARQDIYENFANTQIGLIMGKMGYDLEQMPEFLKQLIRVGEIYVLV